MSQQTLEPAVTKVFGIYKVDTYEVRTPLGPRQVRCYRKVSEQDVQIPQEIAPRLTDREFDTASFYEGVGNVLVQTKQGVFPQPISFTFDEDVTSFEQAFDRFDSHMAREVQRLQAEQQQRQNALAIASESTLKQLDAVAAKQQETNKQLKSGIIMP